MISGVWPERYDIRKKLQPIPSGWAGKEWALLQFSFPTAGWLRSGRTPKQGASHQGKLR